MTLEGRHAIVFGGGVGFDAVQDVPLPELSEADFLAPIEAAARSRFLTAIGRLPRLAEIGDTAALLASDGDGAITGNVVDLSCGAIVQ